MRVPIRLPDGREFPSIRACAKAFNLDPTTVSTHLRKGTLDRLGLETGAKRASYVSSFAKRAKPFHFLGVTYPNKSAAAKHFGFKVRTFNKAFSEKGTIRQRGKILAAIEQRKRKSLEHTDFANAPNVATGSFHAQGRVKPTRPCTNCGRPNDYGRMLCYDCFTSSESLL